MEIISFFIITSTIFSTISFSQLSKSNIVDKNDDNYEYKFYSCNKFDKTNGDEFEILNIIDGGKSEISLENVVGDCTILKEGKSEPVINSKQIDEFNYALYNDSREDNDSFQNASSVYDVGYYEEGIYGMSCWLDATISQKTSGWWLWETKYIDKDFYSFDSCVYGTITVTLTNIPQNCDYDIRAYKLEDGANANASSLNFDNYIGISRNGGQGDDEKITLSVTPGTYYFCVYSYQDKYYDNDNPYHINFEQWVNNTTRENVGYNILNGQANGDLGAIWIFDYKPLGYTPVTLSNNNAVVSVTNYNEYPYIRHLADKYTNGNYINYAVLYVWDIKLRACISAIAQQLVEIVETQTDWDDNKAKSVNIGMNTAEMVLTVADIIGTAANIITGGIAGDLLMAAGILVNATSLPVSLGGFAMSFTSNAKFLSTKKNLLAYLISIQQTFSVGKGSNINETKILRYRYRFDQNTHALNWSPFYLSSDYNFYNDDYISFQIKHSGIDGTVKGFKSETEIQSYLEK